MTNTPVILTHNLTKSYGELAAVRELNLSVEPNSITAFLGHDHQDTTWYGPAKQWRGQRAWKADYKC